MLSVDASGRVRRELQPLEALVLVGEPKAEQVARFGDDFFGGWFSGTLKVNQNRWLAQTDTNFLVGGLL